MDGIVRVRAAWAAYRDGGKMAEHLSLADLPGVLDRLGSIAALPPASGRPRCPASKAAQSDHAVRQMSIRTAARCAYGAGIGGIVGGLEYRAWCYRTLTQLLPELPKAARHWRMLWRPRGMSFYRLIEGGAEIAGRCRPGCQEWRTT